MKIVFSLFVLLHVSVGRVVSLCDFWRVFVWCEVLIYDVYLWMECTCTNACLWKIEVLISFVSPSLLKTFENLRSYYILSIILTDIFLFTSYSFTRKPSHALLTLRCNICNACNVLWVCYAGFWGYFEIPSDHINNLHGHKGLGPTTNSMTVDHNPHIDRYTS